jgi:GntR family transcriptional regulator, transcriptional repressor for pyruvate dehydrogenase complex
MAIAPKRPTLSDELYQEILGRIMTGEYPEGSRLPSESELGAQFNVSRPVIRETLAHLRFDALITSRQGAGSYVLKRPKEQVEKLVPLGSIADIQRCFEYRAVFEGENAYLAAERRGNRDLGAIVESFESWSEAAKSGFGGGSEDFEFHLAIARATKNKFMVSALYAIEEHVMFGMNLGKKLTVVAPSVRAERNLNEHQAILSAIQESDPERAREAMRAHIGNVRRRIFEGDE